MDVSSPVASDLILSEFVERALQHQGALVALESAVITHGLPTPVNVETALRMEAAVRDGGATPATIGVLDGRIVVGLTPHQIRRLGQEKPVSKLGSRDLGIAIAQRLSGGTTVSATLRVAKLAHIDVFATGGIGGVHRENPFDESTDLTALATTPVLVVCSGAKAILDVGATVERLETLGIPTVGYRTHEFPSFFFRKSGFGVSMRVDSVGQIVASWCAHRRLEMECAMLVVNPIPADQELAGSEVDAKIRMTSKKALDQGVRGKALTPFLLSELADASDHRTIEANIALLVNNASLAAQIARAVRGREGRLDRVS